MCHILQAVYTEGNQAAAVDASTTQETRAEQSGECPCAKDQNWIACNALSYPKMARPAQESQTNAPDVCSKRVITFCWHTGQFVCTGTSPKTRPG